MSNKNKEQATDIKRNAGDASKDQKQTQQGANRQPGQADKNQQRK